MTRDQDIERIVTGLEGATQALINFSQSGELTIETADGLQWLALQIDGYMAELREKWDALHEDKPPLKAVEE